MKGMKRIYCLLLAGVFLFTALVPTFLSARAVAATETVVENSPVATISGGDFNISLDALDELTKEQVISYAGASVSDGSAVVVEESSFNNLKGATTVGAYALILNGGGEIFNIVVNVTEAEAEPVITNKQEAAGIAPTEIKVDGNITIDVPEYVEADGFKINKSYDAKVIVNFGDSTSENKTVKISLPAGMRFTSYPVNGTPQNIQTPAGGVLAGFMTGYTAPVESAWKTYAGDLTYTFTESAISVEIPFKVSLDEGIYYGPKVITDGIEVSATMGASNTSVGNTGMDIKATGLYRLEMFAQNTTKITMLKGDSIEIPRINQYVAGDLYSTIKTKCWKKATQYIYYPVGFKYTGSNLDQYYVEHDDTQGYVKFEYTDEITARDGKGIRINLSSADLATAGVYTADQGSYVVETAYDGSTVTSVRAAKMKINVLDVAENRAALTVRDGYSYDYSSDISSSGPLFQLSNDNVSVKEDQWISVKVPSNYYADEVGVPFDSVSNGGSVQEFWYATSSSPTLVKANVGQIIYKDNCAYVNQASLGLTSGNYITEVKVAIGSVQSPFYSIRSDFPWFEKTDIGRVVGRLDAGSSIATFEVSIYAEKDGVEEPGTRLTQNPSVTRVTTNPTTIITRDASKLSVNAGETKTATLTIGPGALGNGQFSSMVNPTVYLMVPENITYSNIRISDGIGGATATMSSPYTTPEGYHFVKITTNSKVGGSYDGVLGSVVTIKVDVTAGPTAKGKHYAWSDVAFVTDHLSTVGRYDAYPSPVADIYDVDMDGDLTEQLAPFQNRNFEVTANESLIIDTYITPVGEGRQPAYDSSRPETAVGFTPGTHADYTVDILNNNINPATDIKTYIPVPKTDLDFGGNLQSEAFKWDMKLGGVPTLYVEDADGADITASVAGNYEISYSTDASSAADYEGATYSTTFDADATMVRLTNLTGMARGERAYVKFDYVVDEDASTLNPVKLGATNAFNPYYSFVSGGNIGALKGTMAGARLEIGEIKGTVFHDTDYDGIYKSGTDSLLTGINVDLYKKNSGGTYVYVTSKTTSFGIYSFDQLGNGDYRVDFSGALGAGQKFTHVNAGTNITMDSDVPYSGVNAGMADGIDPTTEGSKHISAGIISYAAPGVDITKATTSIKVANAQFPNINELLAKTITPTYFDKIKAGSNAIVWSSDNTGIVEVFGDGYIKGIAPGTATVTFTVTDMYGGTASDTISITVLSNELPTIAGSDMTLELGSTFTPWTGITVGDTEDIDSALVKEVTVNTVNTNALGIYDVTYKVTDTDGNVATLSIKVNVVDTTVPVVAIAKNPIYVEKGATKTDAELIAMANVTATDLTAVTTTINQSAVDYSLPGGPYAVSVSAKDTSTNEGVGSFDVYVVDPITAHDFTVELSAVAGANFVTLADAKAWDVTTDPGAKTAVAVNLDSSKPTTVGFHNVTFKSANNKTITVKVLVTNESPVVNEAVIANGFTVKLADVAGADFVALSGAKGYDVTDPANPVEIPVSLVSPKPTTAGNHIARFETAGGGWAEVNVLVTNEVPVASEAVTANGFTIKLADVAGADFVALSGAKGYDVTDPANPVVIPVSLVSAKPTTVGIHTARFETAGGGWAEVNVLVTNESPVTSEAVTANGFTIKLGDVAGANFVALSGAKGYDVTDPANPVEIPVSLVSAKPTTVGTHTARFETAGGGWAEVKVLVTNETPVASEAVTANGFTIKLADVAGADFVALAGAKGYDVTDPANPVVIPVSLVSAKPTTVGIHTARFETAGGGWAEVGVLVTNEAPVASEAVTASGFTIKLTDVAGADFVALAGAKGYDVTNPMNPVEIPVSLISAKPTTVGIHTARFETAGGGWAEVKVLVTNEAPVADETVVAHNFAVKLEDVASADFVALANAKGYDVTNPMNPVEIPVTMVSAKPTTVGVHTVRFETAGGGWAEVKAYVGSEIIGDEVIMAKDFEIDLKDVAGADFVALAEAKAYDMTDVDNPVAITVSLVSAKPAIVGKHPSTFETAAGTAATVNVTVNDSTLKYYVSANHVTITMSELKEAQNNNLEGFILNKTEAKGWKESSVTGIESLSVKADCSEIKDLRTAGTAEVEIYLPTPKLTRAFGVNPADKLASQVITVTVVDAPTAGGSTGGKTSTNVPKKSKMPTTGNRRLEIAGGMLILLAAGVILSSKGLKKGKK